MEAIKEVLAGAEASLASLLAICGSIAGVWALIHKIRKKDEGHSSIPVVQGTLVPAVPEDTFELETLKYFMDRAARLERELEVAHRLLHDAGIKIP